MLGVYPIGEIEQYNFTLRGRQVVLDADLARLFGVETRRLNEQFKRTASRYPADFRFQMTEQERLDLVAACGQLDRRSIARRGAVANLKSATRLPYVYTEHGALMAAFVLRSRKAIHTCVGVVWMFVLLRRRNREQARKSPVQPQAPEADH